MASFDPSAVVERLRFFDGQRLFAGDLDGIDDFNRRMRWLHNQSLHQPGVGKGFAVAGARGDRQVTIGAGYALDALGREIVLTRTRVEPIPPVAGEPDGQSVFFDLTVAYPADAELKESETRQGICLPRGAVRLREEPSFCWVRLERDETGSNLQPVDGQLGADIKAGLRLVLARAEVLQCQLKQPVSAAERLSVRPVRQPYIACDQVAADWQQFKLSSSAAGDAASPFLAFGLSATIDTSSAAFVTAPCYTARIAGDRRRTVQQHEVLIEPLIALSKPQPASFVVEAVLLGSLPSTTGAPVNITAADFADWQVAWMGVE
jgi:hypothetical protein